MNLVIVNAGPNHLNWALNFSISVLKLDQEEIKKKKSSIVIVFNECKNKEELEDKTEDKALVSEFFNLIDASNITVEYNNKWKFEVGCLRFICESEKYLNYSKICLLQCTTTIESIHFFEIFNKPLPASLLRGHCCYLWCLNRKEIDKVPKEKWPIVNSKAGSVRYESELRSIFQNYMGNFRHCSDSTSKTINLFGRKNEVEEVCFKHLDKTVHVLSKYRGYWGQMRLDELEKSSPKYTKTWKREE